MFFNTCSVVFKSGALLALLSGLLFASVHPKVERAVRGSFRNIDTITAGHLILTRADTALIQRKAQAKPETKLYRYYRFLSKGKTIGYGILVPKKVRTKKATVLYAFKPDGTLVFSEIMMFGEAPEYRPTKTWMTLLSNRSPETILQVGKDIPTVSGATLTVKSIADGARIARAILLEKVK